MASSNNLSADPAAQAVSATKTHGIADEIQGILSRMQAEVDATIAAWSGNAHTAFTMGSADIHTALAASQTAVTEVSTKTGRTGSGYAGKEGENVSLLKNSGL